MAWPPMERLLPPLDERTPVMLRVWLTTLRSFAIPFSLILLGFSKSVLVRSLDIIWGLWLTSLSVLVLVRAKTIWSDATQFGLLLTTGTLVLATGTIVFATIELGSLLRKKSSV